MAPCLVTKIFGVEVTPSVTSVESSEQFWCKIHQIWCICEPCRIIILFYHSQELLRDLLIFHEERTITIHTQRNLHPSLVLTSSCIASYTVMSTSFFRPKKDTIKNGHWISILQNQVYIYVSFNCSPLPKLESMFFSQMENVWMHVNDYFFCYIV